jgi:hypothetical protein
MGIVQIRRDYGVAVFGNRQYLQNIPMMNLCGSTVPLSMFVPHTVVSLNRDPG